MKVFDVYPKGTGFDGMQTSKPIATLRDTICKDDVLELMKIVKMLADHFQVNPTDVATYTMRD